MISTKHQLVESIRLACKEVVSSLFNKNESFYYIALITDGEAHSPFLSAWSHEALNTYLTENKIEINSEDAFDVKWFYGNSPYSFYDNQSFNNVNELFKLRPKMDENMSNEEWDSEFNFRISAMENALKELDEEGFFGQNEERDKIMINIEVVPPDETNTERAIRLNPKKAIEEWLEEVAE